MTRILVVEDEPDIALGLEDDLRRFGYEVHSAADGESALQRALSEAWDLILLDVMLPRVDGFEVCRELRRHEALRDVPIIFVTTRSEGENVEAGYAFGGTDYVNKPFTAAELLAKLRSHLGQ